MKLEDYYIPLAPVFLRKVDSMAVYMDHMAVSPDLLFLFMSQGGVDLTYTGKDYRNGSRSRQALGSIGRSGITSGDAGPVRIYGAVAA